MGRLKPPNSVLHHLVPSKLLVLYQQLLKEEDPEAALENFRQILIKINSRESYEQLLQSGFKVIERDDSRTVEETMSIIEEMLHLD